MKGQLYTLESVIAILMILLIIIFLFRNPPESPEYMSVNYKLKAYDGLEVLAKEGGLRRYVINKNTTAIENDLDPYIPDFLNYSVVIFNKTANVTQKLFVKNKTVSVSYFIAGDVDDYKPRDVRVYLWGFD